MRKFSKKDFIGCYDFAAKIPKIIENPSEQDHIDFMYLLKNSEFVFAMKTYEEPYNIRTEDDKIYLFIYSDHKGYKSSGKLISEDFKSVTFGLIGGFDDLVHLSEKYIFDGFIFDVEQDNFFLSREDILNFSEQINKRENEEPIYLIEADLDKIGEEFKNKIEYVAQNDLDEIVQLAYLLMSADNNTKKVELHLFLYFGDNIDVSPGQFNQKMFFSELSEAIQQKVPIPFPMNFYIIGTEAAGPYLGFINNSNPFFKR